MLADLLLQRGKLGRRPPVPLKVLWGTGHLVFHAGPGLALDGVGDGGQEVAGGLARRAVPALALEEGLRVLGGAKVDLAAFVEDGGLVEEVVDGLAGLVDGDGLGSA